MSYTLCCKTLTGAIVDYTVFAKIVCALKCATIKLVEIARYSHIHVASDYISTDYLSLSQSTGRESCVSSMVSWMTGGPPPSTVALTHLYQT